MERNIFIQMSKLHNVKGRINYISSTARQENLYAVYETTGRGFWQELARENQREYSKSNSAGKCIEARELIIALPEEFQGYDPNDLLRDYTEFFKETYGVECISALHHNKSKTNYHIHLIFSERKKLEEPINKIASRNMFIDESGKRVRTKKEILLQDGSIKKGCRIINKGDSYEERSFENKISKFKDKSFLEEVKKTYATKINERMQDSRYKMTVFKNDGPYLPMKKVGKNNPKAKYIRENNSARLHWNRSVSKALCHKISVRILVAVRKSEISMPIQTTIEDHGTAGDMIVKIIDRAVRTLDRFVSNLIRYGIKDTIQPRDNNFMSLLNQCRATLRSKHREERDVR